jgi:nicotinamidase-related amidase
MENTELLLNLRSFTPDHTSEGYNCWREVNSTGRYKVHETAIIICDMWDNHWCRGAAERVNAMAGYMNRVVGAARDKGVLIIHAPSDTMDYYKGAPARDRMINAPSIKTPPLMEHEDPPKPIDDSDNGSDTGETEKDIVYIWKCQHKALYIDQEKDGISDNGQEIYSYIRQKGIRNILIMGVHTNYCILHRSFGIKNLVRWGVNTVLVRDLTDAMYNPERPPYVSHEDGTRLVIEYIEKFWCPSTTSKDIIGK